jgi:hypothetical protein
MRQTMTKHSARPPTPHRLHLYPRLQPLGPVIIDSPNLLPLLTLSKKASKRASKQKRSKHGMFRLSCQKSQGLHAGQRRWDERVDVNLTWISSSLLQQLQNSRRSRAAAQGGSAQQQQAWRQHRSRHCAAASPAKSKLASFNRSWKSNKGTFRAW